MPNWVNNELTIRGPKAELDKLLAQVLVPQYNEYTKSDELVLDFNTIIPMPAHQPDLDKPNPFWGEGHNIGPDERENFGDNTWYYWAPDNWGTKWNAGDTYVSQPRDEGDSAFISFNTAWGPPDPIFEALSIQYPALEFEILWMEEQGFGALYKMVNGEIDETSYENLEEEWDEEEDEDEEEEQ
jgi:hypothetical protein